MDVGKGTDGARLLRMRFDRYGGAALLTMGMVWIAGCETHPGSGWKTDAAASASPAVLVDGHEVSQAPPGAELVPAIIGPPPDPRLEQLVYRLGPYDELRVDVFGMPDLSLQNGKVNLQGLLSLPLIGPVAVNGLTPEEAEAEIARILGERYVRNPRVSVYIINSASLNVTLSGAVARQGVQPIKGRETLSDILAQAGGVAPVGKRKQVVLYRVIDATKAPAEQQLQAYVIDYQQILDGKMRDPLLMGNDKIYVPSSGLAIFFGPVANIIQTWVWPYRSPL